VTTDWNNLWKTFQPAGMTMGAESYPHLLTAWADVVESRPGAVHLTAAADRVPAAGDTPTSRVGHLTVSTIYGLSSGELGTLVNASQWINLGLNAHCGNQLKAWEKQQIPSLWGPLSGGSSLLPVFTRKVGLNPAMPDWEARLTQLVTVHTALSSKALTLRAPVRHAALVPRAVRSRARRDFHHEA